MNIFKKDITVKILAVLCAIVLWILVNPVKTVKLNIPLDVINKGSLQERSIVLKNENFSRTVEISVRGREEVVRNLTADSFRAQLDLSKIKSVDDTELEIDGPFYSIKDITVESVKPQSVKLELDNIQRKTVPYSLEYSGTPKEGYKIVRVTKTPDTLYIENVETLVKRVDSAKVFVNVEGLDRDLTGNLECKLYDENGKEIVELANKFTVSVKVEVAREIPVVPVVTGNPPADYVYTLEGAMPSRVFVTGTPELLGALTEIKTEAIPVDKATKDLKVMKKLILPEGIKLFDSPEEVEVTVHVEKLQEKEITLPASAIEMLGMDTAIYKYEMVSPSAIIKVKGRREFLQTFSAAGLKATASVTGRTEGTQRVPLIVSLPEGLTLMQTSEVEVKIEKVVVEVPLP